ncbi:3-((3aS,4S,7aS)-7a-methyl-1,5-dioxo-octahydro-1H-inden-4-yl)propanoyl:CoA ligase [Pelotomaculum propionicicum]|uniref:3-((3aS,4S,7aS)-7a-methyl-1, 5-dioxo-octahydro-1H-inden-4-yl)propanoyl:CoA ligase n=1 Tax=Pelotomaculum propionicicum TaxID=258475 RepID=A0A4Y7RVI7_9FIRM|nr:AMP-binding protein [Pelotomaculum propionicicum]TEB12770.1 3-((3aS,4S,7aS)-7a-methyl-1,5-dioxo-octahydro-1H-inden-4-yl)propanoyl:CoA ligase [Pelotomaculum propionicicum]
MSVIDFGGITLGELVDQITEACPDTEALVYPDRGLRYTYTEFREACNQIAKGLMKLGVKKGDSTAIWATNVPEWVITQFGSPRMGAVLVTVNTNYKVFELEYLLKQSDSTTLILIEGTKTSDYIGMVYELCPELKECKPGELVSERLPYLKNVILIGDKKLPGMFTWAEVMKMAEEVADEELEAVMASLKPDDVINMMYTSGTTGFPKGVMLTHRNLILNGLGIGDSMKLTPQDRLCIPVPFFHCFGCVLGTMACVTHGTTMVPVEVFDARQVLWTIEKERCTGVHGVPTMFIMELEVMEKEKFDTSSLRTGIMAGSPCPIEVMKKVVDVMTADQIVITYGQTESSPGITNTTTDDPLELRVSTVGRTLPDVEMKIVDPETGQEVGPHTQGEICARGYNIMKGYYKMPEATAAAIDKDGWLHTGDLGTVDENGYLKITGRLKDMIIRGGENIYPREIEEFLYTHPCVKDVQVVGVPSVKYGEEVMAYIQLKPGSQLTEEEVKKFCGGQIARYKIPKYVAFVDGYPITASGKIQKFKLREMAVEMLGLQDAAKIETA